MSAPARERGTRPPSQLRRPRFQVHRETSAVIRELPALCAAREELCRPHDIQLCLSTRSSGQPHEELTRAEKRSCFSRWFRLFQSPRFFPPNVRKSSSSQPPAP